jgi:very-short-patch-repair endonuclease
MSIKHYLDTVKKDYEAGRATEHTHRPALKALLETLDLGITATNEPKRIACGAPDYIITRDNFTIGYIEAKDVGKSLAETERSDQLKRYRRALDNLILTDYLEFRWYVDGDLRQEASLAQLQPGDKLKTDKNGLNDVAELLQNFLAHRPATIGTPKDLAERMARLTHIIRDIIMAAFETQQASMLLQGWREAFAKVLIADLDQPERTADFADMVAQTLAYGLFSARIMDTTPANFSRSEAQQLIPKSNPFLRKFFSQMTTIELDDEPFAPFVDDLVNLLAHTDMEAVLADFGRRTRQQDPVVHFYETFLAAYDPNLRESRGVYYTPEPVVSYIVRSVDHLLKTRFDCPQGLADSSAITVPNRDPGLTVKGTTKTRKTTTSHKVLILDPATGTGTFLYAVIDHIRQQFMQQGNAGMWPGYVKNHLLPRLFGFELLMAPYAVAHFKLSLQLAGRDLPPELAGAWAYHPDTEAKRLGIYLTNALEGPHELTGMPLFTQWVADETNAANEVKQNLPVLVVMGNPPYSVSSTNKGEHIEQLMESYKKAVRNERNIQPLSDDYIKFIRFAQDRIEKTEQGIVAIITNHAYLSGLIHRGMREELMKAFSDIYILNLHGNATIGETTPDGSPDGNVFDIRQGVVIVLFVKTKKQNGLATVRHKELWGKREDKYRYLAENDIKTTTWETLDPISPFFFFIPKDFRQLNEYEEGWKISDIFPTNSGGIKTHRDHFVIDFDEEPLKQRIMEFRDNSVSDSQVKERFKLRDTRDWKVNKARLALQSREDWKNDFRQCLYRPFDIRTIYYSGDVVELPRTEVMPHMLRDNKALLTMRRIRSGDYAHILVSKLVIGKDAVSLQDSCNIFPLYLYPPGDDAVGQTSLFDPPLSPRKRGDERGVWRGDERGVWRGDERGAWPPDAANGNRVPNLNPAFVNEMAAKLGLVFRPHPPTPSPEQGKGSLPFPTSGRGPGGGVNTWRTPPELWQKLKPLARQMRHNPTAAEDKLWQHLRNKQLLGYKFRRQHAIDRFIVDFYCREACLVVEVDGSSHDYTQQEDAIRQEFLESQGLRIIRFTNDQVLNQTGAVLEQIALILQQPEPEPGAASPSPREGKGPGDGVETPSPSPEQGPGNEGEFTPADIFHYIYAIFHSPTYRRRYAEFLKIDFPRVPLTANVGLFRALGGLGQQLVGLHLLESPAVNQFITGYPVAGDNLVEKSYPQYTPPAAQQPGRVYINKTQYFEGMPPDVWNFAIGGYQVCDKWLKDRRGRQLSYAELTHYQQVVVALQETIRLMQGIDNAIPGWPIA